MVEITQPEYHQKIEFVKILIHSANIHINILLRERAHVINMAKVTCPNYDSSNEFWIVVTNLSSYLTLVEKEMPRLVQERDVVN